MYTKLLSIFNSSYLLFNHPVYTEVPSCRVGTPSDIHLLPPTPYLLTNPHYYCKFIHVDGPIKAVFNCYSLQIRGSVIVMLSFKSQEKSEINVKSLRMFRLPAVSKFALTREMQSNPVITTSVYTLPRL
jgi:hypothetical protein